MSVRLYMDAHVSGALTQELRRRGVDVMTAQDDDSDRLADPALLNRATELARVLFTHDVDLLAEGARRQRAGESFGGVIHAHQLGVTVGKLINDLELIAKACDASEYIDRVEYLPL